jgi:hypothetical protein
MHITSDSQTLLNQAPMTANDYLYKARDDIDDKFGEGYAAAHPELVASYMQTCAIDLATAVLARALETGMGAIASSLAEIANAMETEADPNRRSKGVWPPTFTGATDPL